MGGQNSGLGPSVVEETLLVRHIESGVEEK